ncbi:MULTISPECIES: HlyD family efflux transporter periplasmic adaptor subunit [Nostoc]|uniref:HlyD family efflux transporter periplasmic adaptor subunit n=1 Tax=Nostoc paludosum FACHB-159 TaxID=2692908 RepID=A0ABR8K922_9NOSO|nr:MULTISPECIES: HlyD family efflux transporter periplasmic adaptor subunit [Nostoc]MBD2678841.1 HlyD family efflux transporter periplasmic adaptor subunit [Nostoc sp. FACHB-857]MBD2735219.1 HlyD family efflux transporter periplasmic adaptor subunit [Nostoc paludosum FACHB-159]
MPNSSNNSSSAFAIEKDAKFYLTEDKSAGVNPQAQETSQINDWFYGTEELLDALPRVWTRSLLYLLVGFAAIVIPWAMLSKVDETGSARGRMEPEGATQQLDSPVSGSVTAVNVKEGATVKAGQVLVQLESDVMRAELQQVQTKLEGLLNRRSQLDLLKNQILLTINIQEQQNKSQELEKIAQISQAQQNLDAKQSTYNLQRVEKLALVEQASQNISSTQIAQKLAQSRLSRDSTEVERYRQLLQEGAIPQTKLVELEKIAEESQRLQEQAKSDITQAQLRLKEELNRYHSLMSQAYSDIQLFKLRLQEQQSSYRGLVQAGKLAVLKNQEQLKDLQTQITNVQSEIAQTGSQITSLKLQLQQRIVRSPVDGVIFELPIQKPGSVVEPGQLIAQIAPKGTPLILKAQIPNQDSGFLKVGMPVKVKFDAYPFQDYGVVQGHVNWISPDSKVQRSEQGNTETYELEISLAQPYIQTANRRIPITPGQTATAEVVIRQRRIIDFILDPFKKLQQGGLEL